MYDDLTSLRVEADDSGCRLDVFLARRLELSRNEVRRLLAGGKVRLAGRNSTQADKGLILAAGETISVEPFERPEDQQPIAQPELPLTILARGEGWIAVDKPSGVPVHPLEPDERDTVLNSAVARFPQLPGVGEGGLRSGVVHRLDVETSGVLLIATSPAKWEALRDAFRTHRARKIYRAIVLGSMNGRGSLELHLSVTRHKPAKVSVVTASDPDARLCDLTWRSVETFVDATLVEVQLGTGFLHQIRVMLAHLGHPIAGDDLYRPEQFSDPTGADRVMLHASSVRAGDASAQSPDPADFLQCLQRLRSKAQP